MTITLGNLKRFRGSRKKSKRLGRGDSSGHGSFSTRGNKGQKSRSGVGGLKRLGFAHILRATPKFKGQPLRYPKMAVVNIKQLEKYFPTGATIGADELLTKNLIKTASTGIKVLGQGRLTKKFTVVASGFSKTAQDAITKAGGQIKKTS